MSAIPATSLMILEKKQETLSEFSFLQTFPKDVVLSIFLHLSTKEICTSSLVSKEFYHISNDQWIWRSLLEKKIRVVGEKSKSSLVEAFIKKSNGLNALPKEIDFKEEYKKNARDYLAVNLADIRMNVDDATIVAQFKKLPVKTRVEFVDCLKGRIQDSAYANSIRNYFGGYAEGYRNAIIQFTPTAL
jgi:hypothetical protein